MKKQKDFSKKCRKKGCENTFTPFNTLQKYCSWSCTNENKNTSTKKKYNPINKVSKKQAVINSKYTAQRIIFLGKKENKVCFIDNCNNEANTVEHTRGRGKHFFDDFARENNIPMTLDERFWMPCCLKHNLELENNPELSKKYQKSKLHNGDKN